MCRRCVDRATLESIAHMKDTTTSTAISTPSYEYVTRTSPRTPCHPAGCHDTFCALGRHRSLRRPRTKELACAARGVGDDSAKNRRNPWSMKRAAPIEGWALGSPGTHCKRGIGKREPGSHTDAEWASAARGLQSHDGPEGSGAKGLGRVFERRASPAVEQQPANECNLVHLPPNSSSCRG